MRADHMPTYADMSLPVHVYMQYASSFDFFMHTIRFPSTTSRRPGWLQKADVLIRDTRIFDFHVGSLFMREPQDYELEHQE